MRTPNMRGSTTRWNVIRSVVLASAFCLLSVRGYSQVTGATLSGTITDSSGAVIAGAEVSAKNTATGISTATRTSAAGLYSILDLDPGPYEVRVAASGFATAVSDLALAVGTQQSLNISSGTSF